LSAESFENAEKNAYDRLTEKNIITQNINIFSKCNESLFNSLFNAFLYKLLVYIFLF